MHRALLRVAVALLLIFLCCPILFVSQPQAYAEVFQKGGNNGTATCAEYCSNGWGGWGRYGVCVKGHLDTGQWAGKDISCQDKPGNGNFTTCTCERHEISMQEGQWTNKIEFIGSDGIRRYAWLNKTDVSNPSTPWKSTEDPKWVVREAKSGRESEYEWLTYLTQDGSEWRAKAHCHYHNYHGGYIVCELEHKRTNGDDNHNDRGIIFLDWNRRPWHALLGEMGWPFPRQPEFKLAPRGFPDQ
jgi:hypothetical protein